MKKALLMGVSSAALAFTISAAQAFEITQSQGLYQAEGQNQNAKSDIYSDGGNGGKAYAHVEAAPVDPTARAAGGAGGWAAAKTSMRQDQDQVQKSMQYQKISLPDNLGGASANGGEGGGHDYMAASGDGNNQQSPDVSGDNANVANLGGTAIRNLAGSAIAVAGDGNTVNRDSGNITMSNSTTLNGTNNMGSVSLDGGNANGGDATGGVALGGVGVGGDALTSQRGAATTIGHAGDASSTTRSTGGDGGRGGLAASLQANLSLQAQKARNETTGGDADAHSKAYGGAAAGAFALTANKSSSWSKGFADSDPSATARGRRAGDISADASGDANNSSKAGSSISSDPLVAADAKNHVGSSAGAAGGAAGPATSTQSADAHQTGTSGAAGGAGGAGGDSTAKSTTSGGDNTQMAKLGQMGSSTGGAGTGGMGAAGGGTGGAGGTTTTSFSTGGIGALGLGTVSGISTVALNTGIGANQFNSFSINANASFR